MHARFSFVRTGCLVLAPVALFALLVAGCVEQRTPQEPVIAGHPPEFSRTASADFHGEVVIERGIGTCGSCHGSSLQGTAGTPGCFDCHDGAGGHPYGYVLSDAEPSHGKDVEDAGTDLCETCHGADLMGGWSGVSCWDCHDGPSGHPEGWLNPVSSQFHGRRVFAEGQADCVRCHGYPPSSGTAGVSCADCHN